VTKRQLERLIETIILGAIQGTAEWLPISSTGHLRLAEHFLGSTIPILFDVILHVGTLIVILAFFRKDIKNVLSALAHLDFKSENGKQAPLIIAGTIPTALIGLVFSDQIESTFLTPLPIASALVICGILLYSSKSAKEQTDNMTYTTAIIIGTAQGIAIIPGLSRSGTTIAVALLLGLKREKAFKFSFLLSIPAIVGALGLTLYKQHETLAQTGFGPTEILIGVTIAVIVGYFTLKLLHKTVQNRKFHLFAFYCWLLGTALIALSLIGY
jgi:undecaprenyl-diphosphatase